MNPDRASLIVNKPTQVLVRKRAADDEVTMQNYVETAIAYYVEYRKQQAENEKSPGNQL